MKERKFPKEDDVVFCTVSRIFPTTIFCTLWEGQEGVIPISEIAPGRIRNVRDYVKEGKKVVCKVLRVDEERGHITLSLRRVTSKERKDKLEAFKKENNAQAILKNFSQKTKIEIDERILESVGEKYGSLFNLFQLSLEDKSKLSDLDVKDPSSLDVLYELIKERVKPKKVKVFLELEIKSSLPNGVEKIKEVLNLKNVSVKYISAPLYRMEIESENAKEAEKTLVQEAEKIVKAFKNFGEVKIRPR